ncbi:hypothetical protein QTL95_13015 [Rhizobium sp. S152]|uniref:hypothetical protein n=1 Tax=Rhizobium sp. S152 TaxID=3055038 RepID=UPI0025A9A602|nr:hypothetical protein [Rhizobium sp. S152]MDM9626823.1 hypothetical protein [Rhizobium sp. S152]
MTSLNTCQTPRGTLRSEDAVSDTWYPQSLMLRMMQNASRNMSRSGTPRLDPLSMSENLRRDIGVIDWGSHARER